MRLSGQVTPVHRRASLVEVGEHVWEEHVSVDPATVEHDAVRPGRYPEEDETVILQDAPKRTEPF